MTAQPAPILRMPEGLLFRVGPHVVGIDPLSLYPGDWIVLAPDGHDLGPDLAKVAARLLATLETPLGGTIELFGKATRGLDYLDLLRLRTRLGFVHGYGGLLSNRSLRENIALPLSVHAKLTHEEEDARVAEILASFDLEGLSALRPHEVDGATRFRACVARALSLSPDWLVVEGIGAFEAETPASTVWQRLLAYRARGTNAAAICLTGQRPAFEKWLAELGGAVVRFRLHSPSPSDPARSAAW